MLWALSGAMVVGSEVGRDGEVMCFFFWLTSVTSPTRCPDCCRTAWIIGSSCFLVILLLRQCLTDDQLQQTRRRSARYSPARTRPVPS